MNLVNDQNAGRLTVAQAEQLLTGFRSNRANMKWIDHCYCVGEAASVIAKALNLDIDLARVLGLIHDIGKGVGDAATHEYGGYLYLQKMGYAEEYCRICILHPFLHNDITCTAGQIPDEQKYGYQFMQDYLAKHEYTIYEKLICLCDLMCTDQILTVDQRLIEIMLRKGTSVNTSYHLQEAHKLKTYFDELLDNNLYQLFTGRILNAF